MAKLRYIDWQNTAKNLKLLRNDNINLRKFVCKTLSEKVRGCLGECETCKFDMDHSISQYELSKAFKVSESMIVNWENGKSKPPLEYLLFYSDVCGISLNDVIVFA